VNGVAEQLKPPIILFGNVRSGTSMMHDLFDLHPQIKSWYEPRTIWVYADPARKHDRFDAADATPRVRRYIRKRFLKFQRAHGDRRIMEKTPSNLLRIPYVDAIFPEAKYLYMVREPLANLSSSELRWRTPIHMKHTLERLRETPRTQLHYYLGRFVYDNVSVRILKRKHVSVWGVRYPGVYADLETLTTEQVIARQWVQCCRQAGEDLARIDPERVLRVRYEDFVGDPIGHFQRIAAHFDIDVTPDIERALRETVDPDRQGKWRRLDDHVLRLCLPILRQQMEIEGYDIPEDVRAFLEPATNGGP
jgi:hypothetical protein